MRTCTKNYVEGILKLYPAYIKMIAEKEQSILNPDEFYIDQNIGGSRSGCVGRPTEQKVMTLYFSIISLRDTFLFGKGRLERFTEKFFAHYRAYEADYVTIEDMQQAIKDETGFEIK